MPHFTIKNRKKAKYIYINNESSSEYSIKEVEDDINGFSINKKNGTVYNSHPKMRFKVFQKRVKHSKLYYELLENGLICKILNDYSMLAQKAIELPSKTNSLRFFEMVFLIKYHRSREKYIVAYSEDGRYGIGQNKKESLINLVRKTLM